MKEKLLSKRKQRKGFEQYTLFAQTVLHCDLLNTRDPLVDSNVKLNKLPWPYILLQLPYSPSLLSLVGIIMAFQQAHLLISGTYKYFILYWKKALVTKTLQKWLSVWTLSWGEYPGSFRWAQSKNLLWLG